MFVDCVPTIEIAFFLFLLHRELKHLLTKELGIVMRDEEIRRLVDAFDTSKVQAIVSNKLVWAGRRGGLLFFGLNFNSIFPPFPLKIPPRLFQVNHIPKGELV